MVETLDLGLEDANRLKFTPDGRALIIDGEAATLVVMDGATRSVIARVSVGSGDMGDGASKLAALRAAGVTIAESPARVAAAMAALL